MSRRAVAITVALALIAGWFASRWFVGGSQVAVRPRGELVGPATAGETVAHDDLRGENASELLPVSETVGREIQTAPRLHGRVLVEEGGSPIEGAQVSWTSIPAGAGMDHALWIDPASILERTLRSSTDHEGYFLFDSVPPTGSEHVLWASAVGYESRARRWVGDAPVGPLEFVLVTRRAIAVRVLDEAGRPVPRARVVHGAYATPYDGVEEDDVRRALTVYRRESSTDEDGRTVVAVHPGYQAIWAEAGALSSSVWMDRGKDVDMVTLTLVPTFELSASVLAPAGGIDPQSLAIVVYRDDGGTLRFLTRRPVDAWGEVAPVALPVSSVTGYEVGLRGEAVVPRVVRVAAARAGERVHVELLAEPGFDVGLRVSDPDGAPIAGARATLQLEAQDLKASPFGRSDETGLARIRGMAAGSAFLFVDADGYRNFVSGQLHITGPNEEPFEVTLAPSGVLEGRCTSELGPVRDFEVVVWAAGGDPARFTSEVFVDRDDGRFRLEDVPTGDVMVLAFSAKHGLPRCEAVPAHVERERPGRVELQLSAPLLGRGRLIDVTTGMAAEGGFLQPWSNHGGQLLRPDGDAIAVGRDGRFEVAGFGPGDVRMQASAPGYSTTIVHARAQPGSTVEFGTIGIAPLQPLRVELSARADDVRGPFEVSLIGQEWHPIQIVTAGGSALFGDVSPGRWNVHVRGAGIEIDRLHELLPGRAWELTIPISGSAAVEVRVEPRAGEVLPAGLAVESRALGRMGDLALRQVPVSADGVARFEALESGRHALFLLDASGLELASSEIEVGDSDSSVVIGIADSRLIVRVLSPLGRSVPGVHVQIDAADPGSPWGQARESDAKGTCTFSAVPAGEYVAGLWHPEHGWRVGIPLHMGGGREQIVELAFETTRELRVRLIEGGKPIAGVQVHVRDAAGRYPLISQVSDDEGRIAHPSLARGSYALWIDQPGYWPMKALVALEHSRNESSVEIRSTGSLVVTWPAGASGSSHGGTLELVDLVTGERVSDWIGLGLAASSSGSMHADASGRLEIESLPNGVYRWSVVGGAMDGASGDVLVPSRAQGSLAIPGP